MERLGKTPMRNRRKLMFFLLLDGFWSFLDIFFVFFVSGWCNFMVMRKRGYDISRGFLVVLMVPGSSTNDS